MEFSIFGKKFEIGFKNSGIAGMPALSNDAAWKEFLFSRGYTLSTEKALKVAVVIRCADIVAKTMASLGCHLYKSTNDGGKIRATEHPLYSLLRTLPNAESTAYEFWHMYIFNLMLTKGAFAKIVRDGNGVIKELWNIPSNAVSLKRNTNTGEQFIEVHYANNQAEILYDFMYTPSLRFCDNDKTDDFIKIASEVLGLTVDLNNFAKDYFENGSNMGGFVTYPQAIKQDAFTKFKEDWGRVYGGVMNQHKWAILEGGFDIKQMNNDPAQAQALESRKFQIIEICRIMGVTPHKVFALEGVNYNSIEQLNIEFWQETIDPMDERLCQTIFKDLLSYKEQRKLFAKFNTNKLLKGDTKTRTDYYNTMRQNGVLSTNDIRDLEDMNKVSAEEGGDVRLVNGNMIPLIYAQENKPKSAQTTTQPQPDQATAKALNALTSKLDKLADTVEIELELKGVGL